MPAQTIKEALDERGLLAHVVLPPVIDELLAALTSPIKVRAGNDVDGTVTLTEKKTLGFLALDLAPPVPPSTFEFRLVTNPTAHSFRFWLVLNSAEPARKVFEFAAGAAGVVLKAAEKKKTANEELLVEPDPPGPPVSISGVAVALLIEGDPTRPATLGLTPTVGMPRGIVELQLVPSTVLIGSTGFGLEFPITNGVPGAFVIDDTPDAATTVPNALGIQTRADDPAWRGLAARNVLFYLPSGTPFLGGHAVEAYVEVGTAPGEGIDLAISTHIPPVGSRPGIDVIIECRDPAAQGLQDFIPTLVEASMELPLDGMTQSAPGGAFKILAGKPVIARLRFARSVGNANTTATFALESQGPNGVLTVSAPEGGASARILITAAAVATAIVADKEPEGADTGGVILHALLSAAVGLSSALKDQGRFTIHKVEVASTGHGLPAGDQVRFVIDYSVDVLVKPISVGVLSVQMRDEQPMRVRNRNVGLRLNLAGAPGLKMVELDFSRADMEIEDPGGWLVESPASLFDILGTRSGRGSTWLEVDLRFKLNLGPVRVSGATIRATLNEDGTIDGSLRGLDASLEVPGAIKGRGAVQILPSGGITAALDVRIVPLNLSTDGVILYEPKNDTFWLFVQIGVDLPAAIPIANSGLGIYGISGAFGINARPKPPAPTDPDPIGYQLRWNSADPVNAFEFRTDNMTFGAQAVIGTLPDFGFSFSTRAGLFITVPDVIVRGALWARFMSPRMRVTEQPSPGDAGVSFMGVLVVDPADAVTIGLRGQLNVPVILHVDIPVGARFPTIKTESDNWYIYLGTDGYRDAVPSDGRGLGPIRAEVLPDLIDMGADAYVMLRGRGIQRWPRGGKHTISDGLVIAFGFGLEYVIGIPEIAWAEVHMSADVLLATHPLTLAGFGAASGSLNLGPFSVGVDATLALLKVENADPYIHARLCGHIDLFFTDIEGCVELSINSEPKIAVPPPDTHPLDNLVHGEVAGNLAFLIDHQFRRIADLSTTKAGAKEVWADTLLHLSFATAPKLAPGFVATVGTKSQFESIATYPVGLAAKPTGSEMLKYEWTLTGLALYDVTTSSAGTLVKGPLSAAWQAGRDGDLGKRPQAGDLVLLTYQGDLFLNRLADGGAGLPNDPIADAATACQREISAEVGWAVGYVATGMVASFLLPADPVSPDHCVSQFTATLTEHTSLLPANLPLTVQTAAQIPPPFDYSAPALEVFAPQLRVERSFAGALNLSVITAPEEQRFLRVQPVQSAVIVPDVMLTLPRLWLIVDVPVNQDLLILVTDNNGNAWEMTATREVSPGRTAVRFAPRTTSWVASVEVRWPIGRHIAVLGLGGITEAAQSAAAARNAAVQAAAAQQGKAAAKQPQGPDDNTDPGVQCVLEPGHTYRLDVSMAWEGWIYKQTEDGNMVEAGHESNQTTYLPKGANAESPPSTARSFYFRTTPKENTSDMAQMLVALPQYGANDYLQKWRVQRNDFRPEMLSRYLMAYTPGQTEDARFADDPVNAHFSSAHVITLAKAYGFALKLEVRRVDIPDPGTPIELDLMWVALTQPDLLTGVDARHMQYALTAPCPMPKPGATLTAKPTTPLGTQAWYEVFVLAKSDDPANVLDGRLDGVTFRTSRWRNPGAMLKDLGFESEPRAATGDIALRQRPPTLGATVIDGSDSDFEAAMDALGLDGWPAAVNPRVSLLWISQGAPGSESWLCAGLLVESPEPIDRPGRVELKELRLVMSPLPAGTFDIRRSDRLRSRLLWICSTPFTPRLWLQPRFFAPLVMLPRLQLELTDKVTNIALIGSVQVPLAPSFAEEA